MSEDYIIDPRTNEFVKKTSSIGKKINSDDYILNPLTNRFVSKTGVTGKTLAVPKYDYILNPQTNRMVKTTGSVGKQLMQTRLQEPAPEPNSLQNIPEHRPRVKRPQPSHLSEEVLRFIDEMTAIVEKYGHDITLPNVTETWNSVVVDTEKYDYDISDFGRLRNCKTNKILKQYSDQNGYSCCSLWKNGKKKNMFIHRLVALMFLSNSDNKPCVNHINLKRHVNLLANLEWCTYPENNKHSFTNPKRRTLCKPIVVYKKDCVTPIRSYDDMHDAANDLDIPVHNISQVLRGGTKSGITGKQNLHFKYAVPKLVPTDEELTEFEDMNELSLPNHKICSDGRVYSKTRKIISPVTIRKGYSYVNCEGKTRAVHRLVAMKFIPNPDNKPCVNHINGDKSDNRLANLEWATHAENSQHAVDTGLLKGCIPIKQFNLDGTFVDEYKSVADACRVLKWDDNHQSSITKCCKLKRKQAYGSIWRYATDTTPVIPVKRRPMKKRK